MTTVAVVFLLAIFAAAQARAQTYWAHDVSISNISAPPTGRNADIAHVSLVVSNLADADDVLMSVDVPPVIANAAGLHALPLSVTRGASLRLTHPVPIGPRETRTLGFDGAHLVLYGIQGPFRDGLQFPVRLNFQNAGPVEVLIRVGKAGDAVSAVRPGLVPVFYERPRAEEDAGEGQGAAFACHDGSRLLLNFDVDGELRALVRVGGRSYRLPIAPSGHGSAQIVWSDGASSLTWNPGVQLMWMSGATHLMCGRSHHH